ncbi:MAG: radical SAM protein [Bacteroidales bacterium]
MNLRFSLSTLKRILIAFMLRTNILWLGLKNYGNPSKAVKAVRMLIKKREAFSGVQGIPRFFYANKRFFLNPNIPGFPSQSFNKFIVNELNGSLPFKKGYLRLTTLFFSITKKCPLRCEHCLEWERLDSKDLLSVEDLKTILKKFLDYGVSQVQFSGGEPMARFEDLLTLIKDTDRSTDTWLLTSGYNLTFQNAVKLKKAGLTGVRISIDHWENQKHNEFRGHQKAFTWAIEAAENCRKAGLAIGLAVCVVKEFLSDAFLINYMNLARSLKASFILLLEPRETGHFKNRDVVLPDESIRYLENFYLKVNSSPEYEKYPSVFFPGYHQRRIGCFGAGKRYLYIDSEGSSHACPFCQEPMGDSLKDDIYQMISGIKKRGCPVFPDHVFTPAEA